MGRLEPKGRYEIWMVEFYGVMPSRGTLLTKNHHSATLLSKMEDLNLAFLVVDGIAILVVV